MPQSHHKLKFGLSQPSRWLGHSGRSYAVLGEDLARFSLQNGSIYLISDGYRALWVGMQDDLIADSASRARFRAALVRGRQAFRLAEPFENEHSFFVIVDLQNGAPALMPVLEQAG